MFLFKILESFKNKHVIVILSSCKYFHKLPIFPEENCDSALIIIRYFKNV